MVWAFKIIAYLIVAVLVVAVALRHAYWWQVKEYRLDKMWSWVKYNLGWKELLALDFRRPDFTQRGERLVGTGFLVGVGAMFLPGWWFVLAPAMAAVGVCLGVIWTRRIAMTTAKREAAHVKELLNKTKPKVVGISGSFDKSSSKEFLAQILGQKFEVLKTKGSENTLLGVARRIVADLEPTTEVLVIEMGAYKRGEISEICEMIKPDVAWITGIGNQHVDLFGGMENLKRAKFELIEALKPGGVAVFNSEDEGSRDLIAWAEKRGIKTDVYKAKVGRVEKDKFELGKMWVPLRGKHFAANVSGAMTVAKVLGMKEKEVEKGLGKLVQPEKSLVIRQTPGGVTVIDDSYNANEQGFVAAIEYLRLWGQRKYVVSPGIIELGKETLRVRERLNRESGGIDKVWIATYQGIGETLKSGDVVLIEGRVPVGVKQKILSL